MATRNIVPRADGEGKLGTAEKKWGEVNAVKVTSNGNEVVTGPASAVSGNIPVFDGTTGKVIKDSGIALNPLASEVVTGPASAVSGNIPVFDGTTGKVIKDSGIALNPLTSNVTLTVGSGGQYTTINAALEYAIKKYYPIFLAGGTKPRVTIQLQAGFVMAEQVLVESLDLSWITITGVDAETVINRSALTTYLGISYPAFGATNGGFLPIIGQLFNMDTSGTASDRHGILAYSNSRAIVLSGCGVKNAGSHGISAARGSLINAEGADASGAGSIGIYAIHGSTINAYSANASGAGYDGIYAVRGSLINASGADASGAGTYGIYVVYGSIIIANGATGTLGQAKNTLTANGIIFQ